MKIITIHMTDEAYKALKSFTLMTKATGNDFGSLYDLAAIIITQIEKGHAEVMIGKTSAKVALDSGRDLGIYIPKPDPDTPIVQGPQHPQD